MPASYRCADAATERAESAYATGSRVTAWILIEVRGAWGPDAVHDSALGAHVPRDFKDRLKRHHARAVCVRSGRDDRHVGVRLFVCAATRPGQRPTTVWRREVGALSDVMDAIGGLAVDRRPETGWEPLDDPLYLVCTNGRHDQCCANRGRPVVRALRDSPWASRVWECSHVGGDRFAANVVTLPHSLYFGRVEPEHAVDLARRVDAGRLDLEHFRGRTTYTPAEQAVEHFVRAELGVDGIDAVIVDRRVGDGDYPVRVDGRALRVRIARRLVSVAEPLTCAGRPGQLVPEFRLVSIT